jgi:hypothetical protein
LYGRNTGFKSIPVRMEFINAVGSKVTHGCIIDAFSNHLRRCGSTAMVSIKASHVVSVKRLLRARNGLHGVMILITCLKNREELGSVK